MGSISKAVSDRAAKALQDADAAARPAPHVHPTASAGKKIAEAPAITPKAVEAAHVPAEAVKPAYGTPTLPPPAPRVPQASAGTGTTRSRGELPPFVPGLSRGPRVPQASVGIGAQRRQAPANVPEAVAVNAAQNQVTDSTVAAKKIRGKKKLTS